MTREPSWIGHDRPQQSLHPSDLPRPWAHRPGWDPDTTLVWRRPTAAYRWTMWSIVAVAFLLMMPILILTAESPLIFLMFPYVVLLAWLIYRLGIAIEPLGAGWLVQTGRLDLARVEVRTGKKRTEYNQRRVVALELVRVRPGGHVSLDAVLEHLPRQIPPRETIMSVRRNRDTITAFAGWLSEQADVPLREPGEH